MSQKVGWTIVGALLLVIVVMAVALFFIPAPAQAPTTPASPATSTVSTSTSEAPLHEKVTISSPAPGAMVGQTFTVTGEAPGNWYFEAVFPIKATGPNGNVLATSQGHAQSDWMTTAQVPFTATVTLRAPYHGPATLTLMRDNPSGLPQNDDSLSIPVIIQ